jgi:hypothetical protein
MDDKNKIIDFNTAKLAAAFGFNYLPIYQDDKNGVYPKYSSSYKMNNPDRVKIFPNNDSLMCYYRDGTLHKNSDTFEKKCLAPTFQDLINYLEFGCGKEFEDDVTLDDVVQYMLSVLDEKDVKKWGYVHESETQETTFMQYSIETVGSENILVIEDGVKEIPSAAFKTQNIHGVVFPESLEKIHSEAFEFCKIKSLTIPESVVFIGDRAFAYNNISELELPDSIQTIEECAFNSNNITKLKIPTGLQNITSWCFSNNQIKELIIPENVVSIGESAFSGNKIENLVIPENVKSVGENAFSINSISKLVIKNAATEFGDNAFVYNDFIQVDVYGEGKMLSRFVSGAFQSRDAFDDYVAINYIKD